LIEELIVLNPAVFHLSEFYRLHICTLT
jgi:hypothetical protein